MKPWFLLVMLFAFISCKQAVNNSDKSSIVVFDEKKIIGKWGIYSTSFENINSMCNECPDILFVSDGTAFITRPSNSDIEVFSWTLKNHLLTIEYINQTVNKTFSDTIYKIGFSKQNNFTELNIYNIKGNGSYLLRR